MSSRQVGPTYTIRDMARMFRRADELTRENNALRRKLADANEELEEAKRENEDLTAQLYDLQSDLARQMTAPRVIPAWRSQDR